MADKSNMRRGPVRSLAQRLLAPLGEISVLQNRSTAGWGFQFLTRYQLDSSRVDYDLARQLYRNTADKYKLGAAFARPVINATAGFMGAPSFTHEDDDANQALERFMSRWVGKILRVNRNALRDGDVFLRINHQADRFNAKEKLFVPQLVPPEYVTPVTDPLTGQWSEIVICWPVTVLDAQGRKKAEYTVTERIAPQKITIEADAKAPAEVRERNGESVNSWGFIPVVHFANESEETQLFGCSDLEPIEPFLKAYHDAMYFALEGSKLFSRPKVTFATKSVEKFLQVNFPAEEIASGKLKFKDKEIFFMEDGDKASFISADSGSAGVAALLEVIYYCIIDVSETPEFVFGTAVASSKASVSEQMVPLASKIRRKRGQFEEPYGEMASMFLAMWAGIENRSLDTYRVDTDWKEISKKNDKDVADTIKALIEGLVTGVETGLLSVEAASEFLREFVPTMLPYVDRDSESDELRRVAEGIALRQRLQDGQGFEGNKGGGQGDE